MKFPPLPGMPVAVITRQPLPIYISQYAQPGSPCLSPEAHKNPQPDYRRFVETHLVQFDSALVRLKQRLTIINYLFIILA